MNGLEAILQSSVIGTEKLPLLTDALPVSIKEVLAATNDDAETLVLRSAGLLFYYNQCGAMPLQLPNNDFDTIVETKNITLNSALKIVQEIETTGYYEKECLYNLWLNKIISRKERVAPNYIMPLINAGVQCTKQTKLKIIQCIGETGKLIVPLKPEFNTKGLLAATYNDVWEEGNSNDRKIFLQELLMDNFNETLEVIKNDWALESISFKKTILDLAIAYKNDDLFLFLENLYNGEFVYVINEKVTVTQCRNLLAKALLQYEQSTIHTTTSKQLGNYVEVVKKSFLTKIITGANKGLINLPQLPDAFFEAENMQAKYGIMPKNNNPAYFATDVLYWFAELITITPLSLWKQLLNTNEMEVLTYFLQNDNYKATIHGIKENIFATAIEENIAYCKQQQWIIALLQIPYGQLNYALAIHLSLPQFEAFALQHNLLLDANYMYAYNAANGDWTASFSTNIITETFIAMVEKQQPLNDVLRNTIVKFANIGALDKLHQLFLQQNNNTLHKDQWIAQVYTPTKKALEIKQQIMQL